MVCHLKKVFHRTTRLTMEHPQTIVEDLAQRVAMTPTGVWYVCRRYETCGLDAI
jgi:hypothetical protein